MSTWGESPVKRRDLEKVESGIGVAVFGLMAIAIFLFWVLSLPPFSNYICPAGTSSALTFSGVVCAIPAEKKSR